MLRKLIAAGIFLAFGIRAIISTTGTLVRLFLVVSTLVLVKAIFEAKEGNTMKKSTQTAIFLTLFFLILCLLNFQKELSTLKLILNSIGLIGFSILFFTAVKKERRNDNESSL